jgi:phosphatidylserine synthase
LRLADLVTLIGGVLAGVSIALAIYGYVGLAIHVLFLSYALDVLDGIVARKTGGGTKEGLLLDRAFDRVSQVIAPLVVYASWTRTLSVNNLYELLFTLYAGLLIGMSFWRLVYRVVWSLSYFAGLPLFVHALMLLFAVISKTILPIYLLYIMLVLSSVPIPYLRRLSLKSTPSPGGPFRLALALLVAVLPYNNNYVRLLAEALIYALIAYVVLGPLPPLLGLTPSPKTSGRPQAYNK